MTRRPSVLRASPPPCRPGLVLTDFRFGRAPHRQGFPCCLVIHLADMPAPLPRRERPGASVACFPDRRRPSPNSRRIGSRIERFEACSAFTHVPASLLAEPPKAALWHQSASVHFVTSTNRSGCYQPKRQLLGGIRTHEMTRLSMAHCLCWVRAKGLATRARARDHVTARTPRGLSGGDGLGKYPPIPAQHPGRHAGPNLCGQTVNAHPSDFRFRKNAKFRHIYDMGCWWEQELRLCVHWKFDCPEDFGAPLN